MRTQLNLLLAVSAMFVAGACDEIPVSKKEQDSKPAAESKPTDAAFAAIDKFIASSKIDKSQSGWKTKLPKPPKQTFDAARTYYWTLNTNKGAIKVKLLPGVAPMHVTSTAYLTKAGFYDGLAFHRVIPGFMAQGGCPLGTGTGQPGYKYDGEFSPTVRHDKPGLLSMANAGPGTDGSQFFLTFVPTGYLDGKHTIFGEVVDGMPVMKALEACGTQSGRTTEPLKIETATVSVE